MKSRLLSLFLALTLAFSLPFQLPVMAETAVVSQEASTIQTTVESSDHFYRDSLYMDVTTEEILAQGYEYGDVVNVSFAGQTIVVPLVSIYTDVDSGSECLVARNKATTRICLSINSGSFIGTHEITEASLPLDVTITMNEKGAYYSEYVLRHLEYTDAREDYAGLSDAEFANFRCVTTTGMGENILYRSATPIDPKHKRNTYNDNLLKQAGVSVVMNLSDSQETAEAFEGFADTYYAGTKQIYLDMNLDYTSDTFREKLGDGLRFFAQNPGIYEVHCLEGKDRTGFVIAVLECFMGATAEEVVSDYMTTFYNYYGITKTDEKYDLIANNNIVKTLSTVFGIDDFYTADLQKAALAYIKKTGLSDAEIVALRDNLRGDQHSQTVIKNKKAATYKAAGYSGDTYCAVCGKLIAKGHTIAKLKAKKQQIKVSKKASKTVTIKSKKLRKRSVSFKISARAKGKITYKVISGKKKYISVSKSGKVTIRKKAKKGVYKIKVIAQATANGKYKKATKIIKIRVK